MPYKPEKEPKENKSVEELEKKIDGLVSNYERSIKELRREIRSRDSDIEGLMSRNSDQQRTIEQLRYSRPQQQFQPSFQTSQSRSSDDMPTGGHPIHKSVYCPDCGTETEHRLEKYIGTIYSACLSCGKKSHT